MNTTYRCYGRILKKEVFKVIRLQVLNTYRIFTWKRKQKVLLIISDKENKALKTVEKCKLLTIKSKCNVKYGR